MGFDYIVICCMFHAFVWKSFENVWNFAFNEISCVENSILYPGDSEAMFAVRITAPYRNNCVYYSVPETLYVHTSYIAPLISNGTEWLGLLVENSFNISVRALKLTVGPMTNTNADCPIYDTVPFLNVLNEWNPNWGWWYWWWCSYYTST